MKKRRSVRERLLDISQAGDKIERYLTGHTFETFTVDGRTYDAVVRNIEIVSEASRHIPVSLKESAPHIPWREIANIGNLLRHVYEDVNDRIVWETTQRDLQPLMAAVRDFLSRPDID